MGIDGSTLRKKNVPRKPTDSEVRRAAANRGRHGSSSNVGKKIMLDCGACKSDKSMEKSRINRFSGIIRLTGWVISAPAMFGLGISLVMFFSVITSGSDIMGSASSEAEQAGAAIGITMGIGMAMFMAAISLIAGLVGWLLLLKKKVFKCINCGYILDRA